MERRSLRVVQFYPQTPSTRVEGVRQIETFWVDLGALRQEYLDDITAIYCQVFRRSPEDLTGSLELEPLIRDITQGLGFHEARIGGVQRPGVDIRRTTIGQGSAPRYVVRFGATVHGEAFQEAVDGYLRDTARIAKPLSAMQLEGRSGVLFRR